MSTIKITELVTIPSIVDTANVIMIAVDSTGANPVTRKVTLQSVVSIPTSLAQSAHNSANTAITTSTFAYGQANAATSDSARADQRAVTSGVYANSAFSLANSAAIYVTSGGIYANAAYTKANVSSTEALSAGSYANSAFALANGVMLEVHTANTLAQSAYSLANSGYIHAIASFNFANTVNVYSTSSFDKANVAYTLAVGSNLDSLVIVTSSPDTPTGNTGDNLGMVYLANDAFFFCTSAYDGASNIWSKIVASDNW
jgi:hypothetical protein